MRGILLKVLITGFYFFEEGSTTLTFALVMRTFSTIADASNWRSFNTLKLSKGVLKRVWFKKSYYSVVRVKRGPEATLESS